MIRSIVTLGVLTFAMSFCGLTDKLKSLTSGTNSSSSNSTSTSSNSSSNSSAPAGEKAKPTSAQQAIIDSGTEAKWDDQGVSWKLPAGWKKTSVSKESFNYSSPDNAFLIASISVMPDNFPMDISLKAYFDQALQQLKNGKYESAKMVDIEGISGVEFVEAAPEQKDGIRRHQWIGYRSYLGQKQQLNVMVTTKGSNFEKHNDDFQAILYSMKVVR